MGFLPYFTVKYRCIANVSCTLSLQLILVIIRQHAQKNISGQSDSICQVVLDLHHWVSTPVINWAPNHGWYRLSAQGTRLSKGSPVCTKIFLNSREVCLVCFLKGCCWPFPSVFLITSCENLCVSYVGIQVNNVLNQRAAQKNCRKLLRHIARTLKANKQSKECM